MIWENSADSTPRVESNVFNYFSVIEDLHIKELIMEKARYSQDKSVREQALLALQKLMIQNWQSIWCLFLQIDSNSLINTLF